MPTNPIANSVLYGTDNPTFAFQNAMQDQGMNPYAANPFVKKLQSLATPLSEAYVAREAQNPGMAGAGAASAGQGGYAPMDFKTYLNQTLAATKSGYSPGGAYANQTQPPIQGQQGTPTMAEHPVFDAMTEIRNTSQNANNLIGQVRGYRNGLASGAVNAANTNPYMASLSDTLGASGGLGTANWLSDLANPFMSSAVGNSYGNSLQAAGGQAIRRLGNDPLSTPNDIWTYMLGI